MRTDPPATEVDRLLEEVWGVLEPYVDVAPHQEQQLREGLRRVLTPASLEDYDLKRGDQVRYVAPGRKRAQPGRVAGINRDGSVLLATDSGATRSIRPEALLREQAGPRGGKSWVQVKTNKTNN